MTDGQSEIMAHEPTTHDRYTEAARAAGKEGGRLPVWEPDKCISCEHRLHGQACDECLDNPDAAPSTLETLGRQVEKCGVMLMACAQSFAVSKNEAIRHALNKQISYRKSELVDLVDKLRDLDPCPPPRLAERAEKIAGEAGVETTIEEGGG